MNQILCTAIIILVIILIYSKIKGKKGTWDTKKDVEEYAALMGPILSNNKKNIIKKSQDEIIKDLNKIQVSRKPKLKHFDSKFRANNLESSGRFVKLIKEKNNKMVTKQDSIGEIICRKYAEHVFRRPFSKIRPDFLKNPVTSSNLEIDCFCEDLNLGIEYNGKQHYEYTPKFHNSKQDFYNQKYRDLIKRDICMKNGINLIEVPYTVPHNAIPLYLENALKKLSYF
jgi:hypothetical protein